MYITRICKRYRKIRPCPRHEGVLEKNKYSYNYSGTRFYVSGQYHTPAALPPRKNTGTH